MWGCFESQPGFITPIQPAIKDLAREELELLYHSQYKYHGLGTEKSCFVGYIVSFIHKLTFLFILILVTMNQDNQGKMTISQSKTVSIEAKQYSEYPVQSFKGFFKFDWNMIVQ